VFGIFDRYLVKNFAVPFLYAMVGMLGIWLVYDLGAEGPKFAEAHLSWDTIALYYLVQVPFMLVQWMPLSVLLGLLYVLTRMSRRNEIVSMVTAGRSVLRVLFPLIILGLALTGVCTWLNYQLAPRGYYAMNYMIDEISKGKSKKSLLEGHIFVNRREHRIWFIQQLNTKSGEITGIEVTQQDSNEVIRSVTYAAQATQDRARGLWTLYNGKTSEVDADGNFTDEEFFQKKEISGWTETPWQLSSSSLQGKLMTVPELQHYLRVNSDFPAANLAEYQTQLWYRFALPWNVLIAVLITCPLCVVFSRRGALGGVAGGLIFFIAQFTVSNIFIALGQGYRIPALVAAWAPALLFFCIGLYLFFLRATNRPIPFLG
jgi:LPS export ABC transporter permease LptG